VLKGELLEGEGVVLEMMKKIKRREVASAVLEQEEEGREERSRASAEVACLQRGLEGELKDVMGKEETVSRSQKEQEVIFLTWEVQVESEALELVETQTERCLLREQHGGLRRGDVTSLHHLAHWTLLSLTVLEAREGLYWLIFFLQVRVEVAESLSSSLLIHQHPLPVGQLLRLVRIVIKVTFFDFTESTGSSSRSNSITLIKRSGSNERHPHVADVN
jgi:hypothetical protein